MTIAAQRGLEPTRAVLGNRAVVIVKPAHTVPAVTISATFKAGSAGDGGRPGLAHFLARVIDRGTERRTADAIAEALDGRGVALSIGVTRHLFSLSCSCLSDDFEALLELIADIVINPVFPDAEIATRRGEIITAIRQDEDNPAVVAVERLLGLLYRDGHPYGRPIKGTIETVESMTRPMLRELHAATFVPSSLSLVIVGDVTSSRAIDAAAETLERWDAPGAEPPVLPGAPRPASRRQVVVPMMNKAQADIAYGFSAVARLDPEFYAFWVMNNALGQYALGGRLGDSIRERQGMAYYVFSSLDANVVEGPLIIRAGVNPLNVDRAIASIDQEVGKASAEGLTEREVAESKQYLIGSLPRNLETNAGIAGFLQTAEFFGLGLDYDLRLPGLLAAVTREQVHEAARRVLAVERASVVVAGPYPPESHGGGRSARVDGAPALDPQAGAGDE